MPDIEKVIAEAEKSIAWLSPDEIKTNHIGVMVTTGFLKDVIELLKEQKAIIEQYHKADTFLEAHGWKWEGR